MEIEDVKEAWADKFLLSLYSALVKHHGGSHTRSWTSKSLVSICTVTSLTRSWSQSHTQSGSVPLPPGTESREREWPPFLVQKAFCEIPESLSYSLAVAVSLALACAVAVVCAGRSLVSGAACATALLETGAGLSPLQRALCQKHGLKHWKIVTPTALLCSQQHAVRLVSCFLKRTQNYINNPIRSISNLFIWFHFLCVVARIYKKTPITCGINCISVA